MELFPLVGRLFHYLIAVAKSVLFTKRDEAKTSQFRFCIVMVTVGDFDTIITEIIRRCVASYSKYMISFQLSDPVRNI